MIGEINNPLTPEQMRMVRRARVEAMLLGMALAKSGSRKQILDSVEGGDLQSSIVADCLDGMRERNPLKIKRRLASWGIEFDEKKMSLCDRLIDLVSEYGSVDRASNVLRYALSTKRTDLKETLTEALAEFSGEDDERTEV